MELCFSHREMIPCRREKYASVAFFMISGLQVMSVNISKSLARVVLRSLHVKQRALKIYSTTVHCFYTRSFSAVVQERVK